MTEDHPDLNEMYHEREIHRRTTRNRVWLSLIAVGFILAIVVGLVLLFGGAEIPPPTISGE